MSFLAIQQKTKKPTQVAQKQNLHKNKNKTKKPKVRSYIESNHRN